MIIPIGCYLNFKLMRRKLSSISGKPNISMKQLAICVFMLTLILYPLSSVGDNHVPSTEDGLNQQCKRLFSEGGFTEAGSHIARFRSLYPESKHTEEMLFMQAFLQPAIDVSIETYHLIIDKYPKGVWVAKSHFQLAQSYYLQGKYDKALDHYGKIIVSYPDDETYWPARYWKCRSLMASGDYQEAMVALRSLEKSDFVGIGRDAITMALGNCYMGLKDYQNAAAAYRSLVEFMPDSRRVPSAYLLLAKSLQNLGESKAAKTLYKKVLDSYGDSVEAQQAQQYLNSLSTTTPRFQPLEAIKRKPATPKAKKETSKSSYFSIQVGAFSSKSNAEKLARRLRKKSYSVDIITPVPGKSRLYKVRVGRYKTEKGALSASKRLGKNERLETKVVHQ